LKGWKKIIDKLYRELEPYDVTIDGIKEKWGTLRIRFSIDPGSDKENEISDRKRRAEDESSEICEGCGAPGWLVRVKLGNECQRLKTLCPLCMEKAEQKGIAFLDEL